MNYSINKTSYASPIRRFFLAACAAAAMALPAAANIIAVPPPVVEVNGFVGNFGTFSTPGATITLTSAPLPTITANTTGLGPNDSANEYYPTGSISYNVVVTGGNIGDLVPLLITGSLGTSTSAPDGGDVSYGPGEPRSNFRQQLQYV
jgi:hypothetical protein